MEVSYEKAVYDKLLTNEKMKVVLEQWDLWREHREAKSKERKEARASKEKDP